MASKTGASGATGGNVDVTPTSPLYITDENRTFDTVTIYPGGQIFIQTIAQVTIQTLIRKTS